MRCAISCGICHAGELDESIVFEAVPSIYSINTIAQMNVLKVNAFVWTSALTVILDPLYYANSMVK